MVQGHCDGQIFQCQYLHWGQYRCLQVGDSWWVPVSEVEWPKTQTLQYILLLEASGQRQTREWPPKRPVEALLAGFALSGSPAPSWLMGFLASGLHPSSQRGFQQCRGPLLWGFRMDVRSLFWCVVLALYIKLYHLQGVASLSAPLGISIVVADSASSHEREWVVIHDRSMNEGTGGHERGWAVSHTPKKEARSEHLAGCSALQPPQICPWGHARWGICSWYTLETVTVS